MWRRQGVAWLRLLAIIVFGTGCQGTEVIGDCPGSMRDTRSDSGGPVLRMTLLRRGESPNEPGRPLAGCQVKWFVDSEPFMVSDSPWRIEGASVTDREGRVDLHLPGTEGELSVFVQDTDGVWILVESIVTGPILAYSVSDGLQPEPSTEEVRRTSGGTVAVRAVDAESGEAIRGARVVLVHDCDAAPSPLRLPATTDSAGCASFDVHSQLEEERLWWVDVSHEGYAPRRKFVRASRLPNLEVCDVVLFRGTEVALQVLGPDGVAMAGAHIVVEHPEWDGAGEFGEKDWRYQSDADGFCRVVLGREGPARIIVRHEGAEVIDTEVRVQSIGTGLLQLRAGADPDIPDPR